MSHERLLENWRIFDGEIETRARHMQRRDIPDFVKGIFYTAHHYFVHTELSEGGMSAFERQQYMHEATIGAFWTAQQTNLHIERVSFLVLSAHEPIFRSHDAAASLMFKLANRAKIIEVALRAPTEEDKMSELTQAQRARWHHLQDRAKKAQAQTESERYKITQKDMLTNATITGTLKKNVGEFRHEIERYIVVAEKAKEALIAGVFCMANSYFRYTNPTLITMFERQMFMNWAMHSAYKRAKKADRGIGREMEGAMQISLGPVFHAHFSANSIMHFTSSGSLHPEQQRHLQELTTAYTQALPHRVTDG